MTKIKKYRKHNEYINYKRKMKHDKKKEDSYKCALAYSWSYVSCVSDRERILCVCDMFHKFLVIPIRDIRLKQEIRRTNYNIWKRHKK